MCNFTTQEKLTIETYLNEFLDDGQPFTGQDIANFTGYAKTANYIHELFSQGFMPGWAATQVAFGPVMYFRVPRLSRAWFKAREISKELRR